MASTRGQARGRGRAVADAKRLWSARVTATSDALDLEPGVFMEGSPRAVASSLKRSADLSRRRKTDAFRSAMSMLTFYMNRAGANLPEERRRVLEEAKEELRRAYGRPPKRVSRQTKRVSRQK
jgi:hypothetical protein